MLKLEHWAMYVPLMGIAKFFSVVGLRTDASDCDIEERLDNVKCEPLVLDLENASADACSSACCSDQACEVWQFHLSEGCFRGQPYICDFPSSNFAKGAKGARIRNLRDRNQALGGSLVGAGITSEVQFWWSGRESGMRNFATFESMEPYLDGPHTFRTQLDDGSQILIRRGRTSFDISISCWSYKRMPNRCCYKDGLDNCWEREEDQQRCCSLGVSTVGLKQVWMDLYVMVSKNMSLIERSAWDRALPKIEVHEDTFEAKRKRWRVGQFDGLSYCAQQRKHITDAGLSDLIPILLGAGVVMSRTFINIGAGTCLPPDPLHELLRTPAASNFVGIAVDMNEHDLAGCARALAGLNASVHTVPLVVEPATIAASLLAQGELILDRRWSLDVLVVDIDGCDCLVVEELLHVVIPKILVIEINFAIPPPFRFSLHHDVLRSRERLSNYEGYSYDAAAGCSLSYALHVFRPHGLHLLRLTGRDAVFVHESVVKVFESFIGIKLPQDEFECFRWSRLWIQFPAVFVQEWFFSDHPATSHTRIHTNLTSLNLLRDRENAPFALDY